MSSIPLLLLHCAFGAGACAAQPFIFNLFVCSWFAIGRIRLLVLTFWDLSSTRSIYFYCPPAVPNLEKEWEPIKRRRITNARFTDLICASFGSIFTCRNTKGTNTPAQNPLRGPPKEEQLLQLWGTHSKEHRVVFGKASIFRRQQNGHVGSVHSWDSGSNKLQEALEVEPCIKENHVVAFSHLQNMGLRIKKSMGMKAEQGKLLQEKL